MLDLQPRVLAVAAGAVLLGGVGAAATLGPGDEASDAGGSTTASATDDSPTPGDGAAAEGDGAAADAADGPDDGDGAPAGKGGSAGARSTTGETLERMLDRDLSDAVQTYQDAARRDAS